MGANWFPPPVPVGVGEPGTWILALLGFGWLLVRYLRRK
jgi:hypothetical protein